MYVICTLRDFFHIGRVEWVTFHEPCSQESVGGVTVGAPEGVGALEVEGWRSIMCGVFEAGAVVGAAAGCSRGAVVSMADAIAWRHSNGGDVVAGWFEECVRAREKLEEA